MSGFAPGDVVVCVDDSKRNGGKRVTHSWRVKRGCYYRIKWAGYFVDGDPAVDLEEDQQIDDDSSAWEADRFRKINDQPENAELIASIKACKPVKVSEPA